MTRSVTWTQETKFALLPEGICRSEVLRELEWRCRAPRNKARFGSLGSYRCDLGCRVRVDRAVAITKTFFAALLAISKNPSELVPYTCA
jgi:hypothetical protein